MNTSERFDRIFVGKREVVTSHFQYVLQLHSKNGCTKKSDQSKRLEKLPEARNIMFIVAV